MDEKADQIMMELRRIAQETASAKNMADGAMSEIGTHERECALRYQGIIDRLKPIPELYNLIATLSKVVYTGFGIVITVPMIFGIILTLKQLVVK